MFLEILFTYLVIIEIIFRWHKAGRQDRIRGIIHKYRQNRLFRLFFQPGV
jgi:pyridoxine/pyridoxamine 5'-phosphate oxidase